MLLFDTLSSYINVQYFEADILGSVSPAVMITDIPFGPGKIPYQPIWIILTFPQIIKLQYSWNKHNYNCIRFSIIKSPCTSTKKVINLSSPSRQTDTNFR